MKFKSLKFFQTHLLIILIVMIAAVLRFYLLPQTLMFQGDQGRDAIIVARIFRNHDLVFIGPVSSVGNIYLGPFYYYFMLPWLMLTYPSPVGPAVGVAIFGVLTVYLLYRLGRDIVGEPAAIIAAILMAVGSTAITYSRFSWNPNLEPFFSLLMLYWTYLAVKKNQPMLWVLVSGALAILIQLHYVTLLSLPAGGIFWLYQLWTLRTADDKKRRQFVQATILALLILFLSFTPLILFDLKHQGLNLHAFENLFTHDNNFAGARNLSAVVRETWGRTKQIFFEINLGKNRYLNDRALTLLIGIFIIAAVKFKQKFFTLEKNVLFSWLFFGILGTAFYQHTIFDHYILFLLPVTYLVFGLLLAWFWQQKFMLFKLVPIVVLVYFLKINAGNWPLQPVGWQISDMNRTAQELVTHVQGNEKYSVILLSESKDLYGQNYRYFLEATSKPPLRPEEFASADKLFIINENQPGVDVATLPIYEIQTFPSKKIAETFQITSGPTVFVLKR